MKEYTLNLNYLFLCGLFIVFPTFSLPFILVEIYNKKRYAFILLAIYMGLCAIYYPPISDLYRHNSDYYHYTKLSFHDLKGELRFDFILYLISYIFAHCNINFEFIRFLFTTLSYILYFNIFLFFVKEDIGIWSNKKYYMLCFSVFFFHIPFFYVCNGMRYGFAVTLLAYGFYLYHFKHRNTSFLFLFLACITHFSVTPIVIVLFLYKFVRIKRIPIIIISIIILILGKYILGVVIISIPFITEDLRDYMMGYLLGTWNGEFLEYGSFLNKLAFYLMFYSIYPLALILILYNKLAEYKLINLLILLLCIVSPFAVIFERSSIAIIPIFLMCIMDVIKMSQKYKLLYVLLACFSITFFSNIYRERVKFAYSDISQMLYKPLPLLLFHEYDLYWMQENINSTGELKYYQ